MILSENLFPLFGIMPWISVLYGVLQQRMVQGWVDLAPGHQPRSAESRPTTAYL